MTAIQMAGSGCLRYARVNIAFDVFSHAVRAAEEEAGAKPAAVLTPA